MAFNPRQQTKVQYLHRVRVLYRQASGLEACRLAWVLLQHIAKGDVTVSQMENAWNMTSAKWTAKAVILQTKADKYIAWKESDAAASLEAGD